MTSNRDYAEWPEAIGENPLLASAALDRLAHRAHLITITGHSATARNPGTRGRYGSHGGAGAVLVLEAIGVCGQERLFEAEGSCAPSAG